MAGSRYIKYFVRLAAVAASVLVVQLHLYGGAMNHGEGGGRKRGKGE